MTTRAPTLIRTHYTIGRAGEYFDARELAAQTGQHATAFARVALKELVDNGLDAAETAGVAPEIEIEIEVNDDTIRLRIGDNGPGLAPDVLERILDFNTRTSDKSRYRSPTRGAQGNALKTVIGIPTALGGDEPIIIEACGQRHTIRPRLDAAGNVDTGHEITSGPRTMGTQVELTLPGAGQELDPVWWARAFALSNRHATISVRITDHRTAIMHAQSEVSDCDDSYQRSVEFPGAWQKWRPSDPTSPHWYSVSALASLVDAEIAHGRTNGTGGKLLRDFVREFMGLTGTAKAKQVCTVLPHARRVGDLDGDVGALLTAMQAASRPPKPPVLGAIGKEHLQSCVDRWYGIRQSWYAREAVLDGGIPIIVEAFVAETDAPGGLTTAVNFSPTFGDPLANSLLDADTVSGFGAAGLLRACSVETGPARPGNPTYTAVLHIICPSLTFLDRGKSRLDPSPTLVAAATTAIWKTAKTAWSDAERRRKDVAKAARHREAAYRSRAASEWTVKNAAFAVMEQAWSQATDGGAWPASARTVFYQARPLMQRLTDKPINDVYFTQNLLPEYERRMGKLAGVYYEPRGTLYEPHTGRTVPLGTQQVEDYHLPSWTYDKILYIEKQGLWPVLEQARLGERYDMAIIAGAGFASVAARTLLAEVAPDCTIFVVHDADPAGYNIALTLREETARMPDHRIDVIDIGLTLGEAEALGLETETFTRASNLPARLLPHLGEIERRLWKADQPASRFSAICERVELNALTTPQLVAHITQALDRHGATAKVVPDAAVISAEAASCIQAQVSRRLDELLRDLVDVDTIAATIGAEIAAGAEPLTPEVVRAAIEPARPIDWRTSTGDWAASAVEQADDVITDTLHVAIRQAMAA